MMTAETLITTVPARIEAHAEQCGDLTITVNRGIDQPLMAFFDASDDSLAIVRCDGMSHCVMRIDKLGFLERLVLRANYLPGAFQHERARLHIGV